MLKLRVFRSGEGKERYDIFLVEEREGMTVLEALFKIQEELDSTLSFRYSCRGAVCGSCAMLINKVPRLACRTQVREVKDGRLMAPLQVLRAFAKPAIVGIKRGEILVEPLPNLSIIKDLIVDM
ncbi:MAG: 2Fe-2S iron-sulfur cluster binding domain-containing protein, partial [Euryarchaeota archaeon]|nr:2Fe-2S iron-sulfur cluster binding domain-containing protein [Euryarchaeota archaeon]